MMSAAIWKASDAGRATQPREPPLPARCPVVFLAFAYAALGAAGLTLAIPPGYASPVFPASGLALAFALWFGYRALPGVWLGSALLNLVQTWLSGTLSPTTTAMVFAIATGATTQAWAGRWLVNRWQGPAWRALERERDVFGFLLLGGVLACLLSASFGVTSLHAAGVIKRAEFLFTWWNWYVGDTLGVLVFAPLSLCLLNGQDSLWIRRRRHIVAPMLLTLGLAWLAFYGAARWERQEQGSLLQADGETLAKRINDRLITHREVLASLRNFIEVTPDFSFRQFEQFTRGTLQDNPDIFALSFNDLVTHDQRREFERRMSGLSPLGPFQITERDSQQRLVRAAERPEYVAVRYIVPLAGSQPAVGFDIQSEPIRRAAIQRARASNGMAVTAPIRLVQERKKRVGILELASVEGMPASGAKDQAARLLGFAVSVVKVDQMVDIATRSQVPAGLVFQLTDRQAPDGQGLLYRSAADDAGPSPSARDANWKTALRMGDRGWELSVYATESYRQRHRPWLAWAVGVVGLMFAAILQIQMLGTTGQTATIQRKNAALQASEERYQRLFDDSPLPMWVYETGSLRFLMVNDRAVAHYGWPREAFLAMRLPDLLPAGDRAALRDTAAGPSRHADPLECRHIREDGSVIDVIVRASPAQYGDLDARLEVVQDITQDKKNQAQLLLDEKVFDNSGEAIVVTDDLGRVLSTNPAFSSVTGYSAEEARGQNMRLLNSGRHPPAFFREMWRELALRNQWQGEIWNRRKNGEIYPAWMTIHTVRNADDVVTHCVGSFSDITERRAAQDRIEFLAYHDPLTQLPNRRLSKDRVQQAIAHAQRHGSKVAVLFMDLDKFKLINDSFGHTTGDTLLQAVAQRLKTCVRASDDLCRMSGDEFLVVAHEVHDHNAITALCEKIMQRVLEPFNFDMRQLSTSFSIGVAVYPDDGDDTETLLRNADTAMYEAKKGGRNTYRFFDAQMNVAVVRHVQTRDALRLALERQEFELHYQPQISLSTGEVVGAEALLRWNHPTLGLQRPGDFIPTAEDSGLIVPIGEWVIREACWQAVQWREAGLSLGVVGVNLSAAQFQRGDIEHVVIDALRDTGLEPAQLELELTESILIQDTARVLSTVRRLKALGVSLSIDDFGTGYSSLAYLKRFTVDKLKIDQSFVRGIVDDAEDRAIVRTIIQMAKSFNLRSIAEGVEHEDMLKLLRELGCDEVQGYLYSPPLAAAEFAAYLLSRQSAKP